MKKRTMNFDWMNTGQLKGMVSAHERAEILCPGCTSKGMKETIEQVREEIKRREGSDEVQKVQRPEL